MTRKRFAVKMSGAYPAEDLVDRLKWVISELIQEPLELLVWFVSQCEDGKQKYITCVTLPSLRW